MCSPFSLRVDRAMLEQLQDWAHAGMEVARDRAQAPFRAVQERVDTVKAGKRLLEGDDGDRARALIRAKMAFSDAVALDAEIAERVREVISLYERAVAKLRGVSSAPKVDGVVPVDFALMADSCEERIRRFRIASLLGQAPPSPQMALAESDAAAILRVKDKTNIEHWRGMAGSDMDAPSSLVKVDEIICGGTELRSHRRGGSGFFDKCMQYDAKWSTMSEVSAIATHDRVMLGGPGVEAGVAPCSGHFYAIVDHVEEAPLADREILSFNFGIGATARAEMVLATPDSPQTEHTLVTSTTKANDAEGEACEGSCG